MIIQCRKCDTRFRFDDALVEGEGVWVRCSRCQHVFFQERSAAAAGETPPASPPNGPEIPSVRISEARRIPDEGLSINQERPSTAAKPVESSSLPPFDINRVTAPALDKEPSIAGIDVEMDKDSLRGQDAGWEEEPSEEEFEEEVPEKRRWGWLIMKIMAIMVFVVLIAGGLCMWLFPEIPSQALEWASPWLRNIPGIEKLLQTEPKPPDTLQTSIGLKGIRQRSVANLLTGNLWVIEGTAVNQSPYTQARIKDRLVISDAFDAVLGEKIVYCGNLLTDAELSTLAEPEIQRELSIPEGTDFPNEKVAPGGEIPFMIVFGQDQTGAIKTVVTPAGAERVP
jgi:predicted Zn finger-like uncharacterized protein